MIIEITSEALKITLGNGDCINSIVMPLWFAVMMAFSAIGTASLCYIYSKSLIE